MVTDLQVRRLFAMQNRFEHLYQAADAAGISSKTACKYLKSKQLPSQCKVEHTWRTRKDFPEIKKHEQLYEAEIEKLITNLDIDTETVLVEYRDI